MIVTTTPAVDGYRVSGYYGIVFGEVITGVNFLRDFGAGIRNIVGGRSEGYEQELHAGALRGARRAGAARRRPGRARRGGRGHRLRGARPGQHAHGDGVRYRRRRSTQA